MAALQHIFCRCREELFLQRRDRHRLAEEIALAFLAAHGDEQIGGFVPCDPARDADVRQPARHRSEVRDAVGAQVEDPADGNRAHDGDEPAGDRFDPALEDDERRLDVFNTLDELKDAIPEELYTSIAQYLGGEDVEILDI